MDDNVDSLINVLMSVILNFWDYLKGLSRTKHIDLKMWHIKYLLYWILSLEEDPSAQ